jgi:hypothetical protein
MAKDDIDRLLHAAVSDGRVPGVVALAADRNGTFYQGRSANAASAWTHRCRRTRCSASPR